MLQTELTEVAEGILELRLPIPFEDGSVNTFLLPGDGFVDLVDCGMATPDSMNLIRGALERLGGRLRRLVVTHIHPDHYGAAGVLTRERGAELFLHRLEVPLVHPRYLELDQLVAEVETWLLVNGVGQEDAEDMKNASRAMRDFVDPAVGGIKLEGAETLELGRRRFRVEWTPGHSPGHICLYDASDGVLIAGDQLLPELSPNIGLHPQSTPDPLDAYIAALRRLASYRPSVVLPAHGRPFNDAGGRVDAMIAHHERRKEQILEIVGDRRLTGWQVALEIWGPRTFSHDKRLALMEGLAHLQSLATDGRLEKDVEPDSVTWRRPG